MVKCKNCSKRACYNILGETKAIYCYEHKTHEMINVVSKKCISPGCKTRPNFNILGESKAIYCSEHKLSEMINVVSKTCISPGCKTRPNFNILGESKAIYCSEHKLSEMINIKDKTCISPGCTTQSTFNILGETKAIYCSKHKLSEMINIKDKTCIFPECMTQPIYNILGETKAIYCSKHKLSKMINIKDKTCISPGCNTIPVYNILGETKSIYCYEHKSSEMINIKDKTCKMCDTRPSYGIPGNNVEYCSTHKQIGNIKNPKIKCESCKCIAIYGTISHTRCEQHKLIGDTDFVQRKCNSCSLSDILDINSNCNTCDPTNFTNFRLYKQKKVSAFLSANEYIFTEDKIFDLECGKERPDFIIECLDKIISLEIDEDQHKSRLCECEQSRMVNLSQAYGMPTIFIRYNPDKYKIGNKIIEPDDNKRLKKLKEWISFISKRKLEGYLEVLYLFYDNGDNKIEIITPFEI
jgi:hypothetical protein